MDSYRDESYIRLDDLPVEQLRYILEEDGYRVRSAFGDGLTNIRSHEQGTRPVTKETIMNTYVYFV